MMLKKLFLFFITSFIFSAGYAEGNFADYQNYAASLNPQKALSSFHPEKTFAGYSSHSDIDTDVIQVKDKAEKSDTGVLVIHDAENKSGSYPVDYESPEIKEAMLVEANAEAITQGHSNPYVNCEQKPVNCTTTTHNEVCNENASLADLNCHERLVIHVEPHAAVTQKITVYVASYARDHTNFVIDLKNGKILSAEGAQSSDLKISTWATDIDCATSSIVYNNDEQYWNDPDLPGEYWTDRVYLTKPTAQASCANPIINVSYDQGHQHYWRKRGITFSYTITYVPKPSLTDEWIKDCPSASTLIENGFCHLITSQCTSGESTHIIDNFPISRSCWEREETYSCQGNLENTCMDLKAKQCTQVYSQCSLKIGNLCLGYQQTYACQDQTCAGSGIMCGGDFFCMKGDCSISTPTQNKDMAKAASEMAAANAAAEDVKKQNSKSTNIAIFSGTAAQCSDDVAGFSNCCRASGWGQDINLAHCTQEEQTLGHARETEMAIPVGGSYCSHEVAGVCLAHKKSFCMFDSKMAMDVQRDGRAKQLNIPFGDAKDPDCRGLSPDELKSIDFSKVDLSNIVEDVKNNENFPQNSALQQKIIDEIARKRAQVHS